MNRKELVKRASELLRENGVRKSVRVKNNTFVIQDGSGQEASFEIKSPDKKVLYTIEDIDTILDALIESTINALQEGEDVSIRGFGTLCLRKRRSTSVKHPLTDETYDIPEKYVPKFQCGERLRLAAKILGLKHPIKQANAGV